MDFRNKKILVVAAHPDDEVLGSGGTLHSLSSQKKSSTAICMLSKGVASRFSTENVGETESQIVENLGAMQKSFNILGFSKSWEFDFPDNQFDSVNLLQIIKAVESAVSDFDPDIVLTHHHGDLNIDHRLTSQAVFTATRPIGERKIQVITFETPSSSEWQIQSPDKVFTPNMFYELSEDNLVAKIRAIEVYENEIRDYPHPRSSEALKVIAKRWGTVSGFHYAEAFNVLRWYEPNT